MHSVDACRCQPVIAVAVRQSCALYCMYIYHALLLRTSTMCQSDCVHMHCHAGRCQGMQAACKSETA